MFQVFLLLQSKNKFSKKTYFIFKKENAKKQQSIHTDIYGINA